MEKYYDGWGIVKVGNDFDEIYDFLVDQCFFTEKELDLVCCLEGHSIQALNDAIFARYGCRDIEQLCDENGLVF